MGSRGRGAAGEARQCRANFGAGPPLGRGADDCGRLRVLRALARGRRRVESTSTLGKLAAAAGSSRTRPFAAKARMSSLMQRDFCCRKTILAQMPTA